MRTVAVCLLLLLAAGATPRQSTVCTEAEEQRAGRESDQLRTWDALYASYKRYHQCDDGDIADGYSESVARILVDHWRTLDRMTAIGKQDGKFRRFVLSHVDDSMDPRDLSTISLYARSRCSKTSQTLCNDLVAKIGTLGKQIASVR